MSSFIVLPIVDYGDCSNPLYGILIGQIILEFNSLLPFMILQ